VQAVILAGGLGTRLRPVTDLVPKPMVAVAGKPYLEHQLVELQRQGIADILILTGYLGEQIEAYFGDGSAWEVSIRYSREPEPIGTGGALRLAGSILSPTFLVIYGDSFLPFDYRTVVQSLEHVPAALGAVVVYDNSQRRIPVPNNIALDASSNVTRYEKTLAGSLASIQQPLHAAPSETSLTHVDAGVLAFRRGVVEFIPPGKVSLEQEIFPRLIEGHCLVGIPTDVRFYDIGTPERLKAIEEYFGR
jgi:NDP-sugar pyrophosphorylase family protein